MLTAAVTPRRCHKVDPFNADRRAVGVALSTDAALRLPGSAAFGDEELRDRSTSVALAGDI